MLLVNPPRAGMIACVSKHAFPGLAALALSAISAASPAGAGEASPTPAQQQFAWIASLEGQWQVAETDALRIVFEKTARGHTMVERWETATGLHSMTVYHLDGDRVIATHYCPQGNQPRLASLPGQADRIAFRFLDVTDFDEGESHTFTIDYAARADGSVERTEVYRGAEGLEAPSTLTLSRIADATSDEASGG